MTYRLFYCVTETVDATWWWDEDHSYDLLACLWCEGDRCYMTNRLALCLTETNGISCILACGVTGTVTVTYTLVCGMTEKVSTACSVPSYAGDVVAKSNCVHVVWRIQCRYMQSCLSCDGAVAI